jgi:hypothetical protein
MARYQILYWEHIPIGVKATDAHGMVRENLPRRFQEVFERTVSENRGNSPTSYSTSGFRWSEEKVLAGSAADVVALVVRILNETWDQEQALTVFEQQKSKRAENFLDLSKL